jgi:acetoin utilization deacetylase AcuC-like enzyme
MSGRFRFFRDALLCSLAAGLACTPGAAAAAPEGARVGYVWDARFKQHDTGKGHPESAERLDAIDRAVASSSLKQRLTRIPPRMCAERWLLAAHGADYLKLAQAAIGSGQTVLPTGDTTVSAASFDTAGLAAGSVLAACDAVLSGQVQSAFCAVRPPGHHATTNRGMGFCMFNNVAIAARYLRLQHGIQRILIVDWDVHHGNGTYAILKQDPHVFQFHLHQSPLYPGTGRIEEQGEGPGKGFTINNPLPAGAGINEILPLFQKKLLPAMETFRPQFILISAGFDAHQADPLGGLKLTTADYARLTGLVCDLAERHCGGRIVSVLEGGYNLTALGDSVVAHLQVLADRAGKSISK